MVHSTSAYSVYFGNASDCLYSSWYQALSSHKSLLSYPIFKKCTAILPIRECIFLSQVHGTHGEIVSIDSYMQLQSFVSQGDYLTTNMKHMGIGVVTADCLPIVMYDTKNNSIAIVHAGWRGTVQNIVLHTIDRMKKEFGTQAANLFILFGPSARECCYEVKDDFIKMFKNMSCFDQIIIFRNNKFFFNLVYFNVLQLVACGVPQDAFLYDYNLCTICDHSFFSYRRQGVQAGRQMTITCLK